MITITNKICTIHSRINRVFYAEDENIVSRSLWVRWSIHSPKRETIASSTLILFTNDLLVYLFLRRESRLNFTLNKMKFFSICDGDDIVNNSLLCNTHIFRLCKFSNSIAEALMSLVHNQPPFQKKRLTY